MTQQYRGTSTEAAGFPLHLTDGMVQEKPPRISVVIPTCNEAKNLPYVLSRLPSDVHEVIVVDGQSVDDTVEAALWARPDVRMVLQNRLGRGYAMAAGLLQATGDILVTLDADGSADPQDIPRLVAALSGGAGYARGARRAELGGRVPRAWADSRWVYRTAGLLRGTGITGPTCGCTAFWAGCLAKLDLDRVLERLVESERWANGPEIEALIQRRIARAGLRIADVPVHGCPDLPGDNNVRHA